MGSNLMTYRSIFSLMLVVLLSGCGFHLRGLTPLSPSLSPVYVSSAQANNRLLRPLQRSLTNAGVTLSDSASEALHVLHLQRVVEGRRISSTTDRNKASEYQLTLTAEF